MSYHQAHISYQGFDTAYRVRNSRTGQYSSAMIPSSEVPRDLTSWNTEAGALRNLSDLQLAMSTELNRIGQIIEGIKPAEAISPHYKSYVLGLLDELGQKWLYGQRTQGYVRIILRC